MLQWREDLGLFAIVGQTYDGRRLRNWLVNALNQHHTTSSDTFDFDRVPGLGDPQTPAAQNSRVFFIIERVVLAQDLYLAEMLKFRIFSELIGISRTNL